MSTRLALLAALVLAVTSAPPPAPDRVQVSAPDGGAMQVVTATAVNIQLGTVSANVYWNCQGFQAP